MAASNGGTVAPLNMLLIPVTPDGIHGVMYTLDPTNFNDQNSPSNYSWKVEDVVAGRTPSCGRIIITVRDLGVATITVALNGIDQNTQTPISVSTPLTIGTIGATGAMLTYLPGLELTAQNLQLSVFRAFNAGPVCIVKVRLEGRFEMTAYA